MTIQQKEKADKINWWHTIRLSDDYLTKGRVGFEHCSPDAITERFGMPENLKGKTVLDVGGWDGLFSFEAEKRGAAYVYMIDCFQNKNENADGFLFAREILNSDVRFDYKELSSVNYMANYFDVVLFLGVLYHTENPIQELKSIYNVCRDVCLIETAISSSEELGRAFWEFKAGHENDETNKWYPTTLGLYKALEYVGFKKVEQIWTDGIRMTVKAIK